jgi:hypothetical protein
VTTAATTKGQTFCGNNLGKLQNFSRMMKKIDMKHCRQHRHQQAASAHLQATAQAASK